MSLPQEVAYWGALAELRMNENGLQRLPETLGLMTSLEHAGFANNVIDSFPAEVNTLSKYLYARVVWARAHARVL